VEILEQHHQRAMLCKRRHKVAYPIEERRSSSNHVGDLCRGEGSRRGKKIGFRLVVAERIRPRAVWRSIGKIVAVAYKREAPRSAASLHTASAMVVLPTPASPPRSTS
jgi:Ni,Fe-hydrogenase III large subunit